MTPIDIGSYFKIMGQEFLDIQQSWKAYLVGKDVRMVEAGKDPDLLAHTTTILAPRLGCVCV